jgi:toxin YoeB
VTIAFDSNGWEDYRYWVEHDRKITKRIHSLIESTLRSPFEGIGNPEPLKHELAGMWSRRIDGEHRFVYYVRDDYVVVVQCRYHY